MSSRIVLLMTCAAMFAGSASSQQAGSVEFGGFGRYTRFDQSLEFGHRAGGGGRLGIFLLNNLEVEGSAGYTQTTHRLGGSIDHFPIAARLIYNARLLSGFGVLFGAGYLHNEYRGSSRGADNGVTGLAGFRITLANTVSLRAEWVGDYSPHPTNVAQGVQKNLNMGGQLGLSIHLGNWSRSSQQPRSRPADSNRNDNRTADSDNDGIGDPDDRCPETQPGATVDSTGCPTTVDDADSDGVSDVLDTCPGTPEGTRVDPEGCPAPDDTDSDGVPNPIDMCADTPADLVVDDRGCGPDTDGDAVPNHRDRCPATPFGARVDEGGCRILFAPGSTAPIVLEGVAFSSGSSTLTPGARAVLDWVAQALMSESALVEIGGHTDSQGRRATNIALSQRRATAVLDYLVLRGVPANQLIARGYGPDVPLATNATVEGRSRNRRVELVRIP